MLGASWYVLSIQRQYECWRIECAKEMNSTYSPSCNPYFLDCSTVGKSARNAWLKRTNVIINCDALNDDDKDFQFGMFSDAFTNNVASSAFPDKYFYCLWWGLKNLWYIFNLIALGIKLSSFCCCCFSNTSNNYVLYAVHMDKVL